MGWVGRVGVTVSGLGLLCVEMSLPSCPNKLVGRASFSVSARNAKIPQMALSRSLGFCLPEQFSSFFLSFSPPTSNSNLVFSFFHCMFPLFALFFFVIYSVLVPPRPGVMYFQVLLWFFVHLPTYTLLRRSHDFFFPPADLLLCVPSCNHLPGRVSRNGCHGVAIQSPSSLQFFPRLHSSRLFSVFPVLTSLVPFL